MRAKKNIILFYRLIKILPLASLSLSLSLSQTVPLSLSLIHSHLIFEAHHSGLSLRSHHSGLSKLITSISHHSGSLPTPSTQAPSRQSTSSTHASAHFSSVDQTHADTVLPKLQATITAHLSILFTMIEFFFLFFVLIFLCIFIWVWWLWWW